METLLNFWKNASDVDLKTETLIDDNILDSFDIVTLVGEINEEYDINILQRSLYLKTY